MSRPSDNEKQKGSTTQKGLASLQEAGRYLHLGFEFLGAIIFFVGIGYLLDRWLESLPAFTLVGVVLAFAGIIIQIVRFSNKESMEAERRRRERKEQESDA